MIHCDVCGRFISNESIRTGEARRHFTPDNAFGGEDEWWECRACITAALNRKPPVSRTSESPALTTED